MPAFYPGDLISVSADVTYPVVWETVADLEKTLEVGPGLHLVIAVKTKPAVEYLLLTQGRLVQISEALLMPMNPTKI